MVDPATAKVIISASSSLLKSKTFRVILVGVVLLCISLPMLLYFSIADIDSVPTVIYHWGKGNADLSNGDQKTLSEYKGLQSAFTAALNGEHQRLLDAIQSEVTANGYIKQDAAQNQAVRNPGNLRVTAAVFHSTMPVIPLSTSVISDDLRQKLLKDVTAITGNKQKVITAIQHDATKEQMEEDISDALDGQDRLIDEVAEVIDRDFSAYVPPSQPQPSDPDTPPDNPPPPPPPPPPKKYYKVVDNYTGAEIGTANYAITAYSLLHGEAAAPDEFKSIVQQNAGAYFTYGKATSTYPNGDTLTTYTIQYNAAAGKNVFRLTSDQTLEVTQLSDNLQILIDKLEGKGGDSVIDAGKTDNGMGVSDSLIQFLEKHEGYAPTPERGLDSQNLTVGYGHVVQPGEVFTYLTPQQAEDLLKSDLPEYINSVQREFAGMTLKQNQFDALVSLCYNLGPNIWSRINLTNAIKSNATPDVLQQDFESLDYVNGSEAQGLLNRRIAEYQMFVNGVYTY